MGGVVDQLIEKLDNFLGRILFAIERLVCLFISWLQQLFGVFSGITKATYNDEKDYLVNVFFGNRIVNAIYWGMAAIGIVMVFIFTIIAVTKKGFDLDGKMQRSHGQILRTFMRSIFIILSLSLFMTITISFTNVLMDSVNDVFNRAPSVAQGSSSITYTNEQFAAMGRIFNTVGNYSLNPSKNNRYNINACYNEIRGDLKYLADTGVFNFYYTTDENGEKTNTWQSVLQELAVAADYNQEQPADAYNESIANAMDHCVQVLNSDYSFHAMSQYSRTQQYSTDEVFLDRVLFLSGTMGIGNSAAARNDAYNKSPDMLDNVRAPYYTGDKNLYDLDQVNEDFHVSFSRMNYLLIYLAGIAIIVNMAVIIVNCIVRIFNLLFLYVIAPPIIASAPLDDGGKLKQRITAFIVQAFSVFATVISMRIFLIFIPIVMSPKLQLVDNPVISTMGKLVMIWAGTVAIEKANGLLTGILADSAGWQSIMAGSAAQDVKGSTLGRLANAAENKVESAAMAPAAWAGSKAVGIAKGVGRTAALPFRPLIGAVSNAAGRLSSGFGNLESNLSNSLVESPAQKQKNAEAQERKEAAQERQEQKQFRQTLTNALVNSGNDSQGGHPGGLPPNQGGVGGGKKDDDDNNGGSDNGGGGGALPPNLSAELGDGDGGLPANLGAELGGAAEGTGADVPGAGANGRPADHGQAGAGAQNGRRQALRRPLNAVEQGLFGTDAQGIPVGSGGAGAKAPGTGAQNRPANPGQRGTGAQNGRRQAPTRPLNKGTQKLFGVNEQGVYIPGVTDVRAPKSGAKGGPAGPGTGSGSNVPAGGAGSAQQSKGRPDPALQKLFSKYGASGSRQNGASGSRQNGASGGGQDTSRPLAPEVQKLFDDAEKADGSDPLPMSQAGLDKAIDELDTMMQALGVGPGAQGSDQSGPAGDNPSGQEAPINIPPSFYETEPLDEDTQAQLPYDSRGILKDRREREKAIQNAEKAMRNGGVLPKDPKPGEYFYADMRERLKAAQSGQGGSQGKAPAGSQTGSQGSGRPPADVPKHKGNNILPPPERPGRK